MIKRIVFLVFLSAFVLLLMPLGAGAQADEEDVSADGIIEDFSAIIPEESGISTDEDSLLESIGVEGILKRIMDTLSGEGAEMLTFFLTLIGFAVLSVLSDSLSFGSGEGSKTAGVGVMVLASFSIYPRVYSIFESVRSSLESVSSFFGAALPVLTALTTASGSLKSAGVQAMNMNITLGIVGAIASRILLPLSLSLLSFALVSSFGDGGAASLSKSIKSFFTFGLGIVTAVSSAAITLQSVIASASDSAALRAARYAAGSLIPVVGSSVSSAISTLSGGLAYAKSTVGAASIAVIAVISIAPLLSLLAYRMMFSMVISFLEYLDNPRGVRCFSAYRTAFDAVISVYVMSTLVCIIQVIVFMKGGASLQ